MPDQLIRELRLQVLRAYKRIELAHRRNIRLLAEKRELVAEIERQQKYIEELRQALDALQSDASRPVRRRRI